MSAVARKGDAVKSTTGSGVGCKSPLDIKVEEVNSSSVHANGKLIVVEGNKVMPHVLSGCSTKDESVLDKYSPNVYIGNKKVGRKGDGYNTAEPNTIMEGSPNVFANGNG